MQDCTFSANLSSGSTWLIFPNHIREGCCVFLQPLFALTPGRQSGAAWHGEPEPWPLLPSPRAGTAGSCTHPQWQGQNGEDADTFVLGARGCLSTGQASCTWAVGPGDEFFWRCPGHILPLRFMDPAELGSSPATCSWFFCGVCRL